MNGFLVDTNVLSELTRSQPDIRVVQFLQQSKSSIFVSVLSVGEIRKGIASLPLGGKRTDLENWLEQEMTCWFGERLLPVTLAVAERWGDLAGEMKMAGRSRPVLDALIAATALMHDLTIVTRNVADFQGLGVRIFNPWAS